jgi:2-oxoglutarate/2-oxoacid ferredoxin oxidoreductase subunit beta
MNAIQTAKANDEILTGLIYINPDTSDLHELIQTNEKPLNKLTQQELCPGSSVLADINADLR